PRGAGTEEARCPPPRGPRGPRPAPVHGPLGAVALLELLTRAAPAGIVASHLVLVVDHTLLARRPQLRALAVGVSIRAALGNARGGSGRRQRARPRDALSA